MSIKDFFNNPGVPKIQKAVTSDEMVATVESSDYIEAKKIQHDQFIPPIDFTTASNFAKFGSAELYYEKAFERIHNYYPYDGTLHEKIEFENSSSYLDKYVFENLYPRTNGYLTFSSGQYIEVFGGPHTASAGMIGKTFDSTFDLSMKYDEEKKRTSAFEFRGEDGITAEFWLKTADYTSNPQTIFHISGTAGDGDIEIRHNTSGELRLFMNSGSANLAQTFSQITDNDWNYYAVSVLSSSAGITIKGYKNGQLDRQVTSTTQNIHKIIPTTSGLNMRVANNYDDSKQLLASLDELRFWKTARTPEQIFNMWFTPVGGGTNKYDANVALSCYFKFNEGITGNSTIDKKVLDYSGRINNGTISNYAGSMRNTGSAITEKLNQLEFKDPIIYSSHPDVVSKKTEYKTSGSLADKENSSTFFSNFPAWMQEDDGQNGNQLKYLSQVLGSYFDTLWHQINYLPSIHDIKYIDDDDKPLPFAKKLLMNEGFVLPDIFVDSTITEEFLTKDENEIYSEDLSTTRNRIYHNIYNNLSKIYKTKGTEKSFRNFFRALGIGNEVVKLKMYADDSTFVLRNNYEFKSHEKKYLNFNNEGQFDATIYQTSSANNSNKYIPGDNNYTGSFSIQTEVILPRKQKANEFLYNPFPYLSSSIFGYKEGTDYATATNGLQVYVVRSVLENTLNPKDLQQIKFVLTGSNVNLVSDWYYGQYENNKWSLAVRLKHSTYPRPNITGSSANDYLLEFYGVEADGNNKKNYFLLSTSSVNKSYYSSDKIFYAGANRSQFTGSTLYYSDVKLGYIRYWHSYLSNDAIDQHAFDTETFGINEPFEQDLIDVYPVEIPREKTLSFHWAFNDLTGSDSSGELTVSDLSSGSSNNNYGLLSGTIEPYVAAKGEGFNASSGKALDKLYIYSARKRLPDDLLSSDLTTIKTDETEQFFVDEDVSDHFYSFEKSMWGTISEEMMNMFSTALDLNNLIGQPNQKYHQRYNMADFLRDRFFDDVENEPSLEKFTSFYKWIDDSISIGIQQLIPASTRFSEKINNVIESHVLERSKYVHQIPITTNFSSTEGSIKGHAEMNYNWQFGHAPETLSARSDEANHVLWQQERKQKDGLRETLRNSRNNHSIQSSGLIRRDINGTANISDTYAIRKFAKTYDVGMVSQQTIHGGTNFGRKKNLQLFHESIAPAGRLESVPQNVVTVGVGDGQGIVQESGNNDLNPRKKKYQTNAEIGNRFEQEYGYQILGDFVIPMNIMSGTINSGFNALIEASYSSGVHITNLHNDVVGNYNEVSVQGPFTEQHVGGLQYRHIDLNDGNDSSDNRPEGWGLSIAEHPVDPAADGALGFVGADYDTSGYPDSQSLKATRYRDEHAKRPVNIRNIKTISGSQKVGNYTNEIQLFSVSPTFQKTWAIEAYSDASVEILPTFISSALPLTTHYQTLIGIAPYEAGNVFGGASVSNRQPDTGSLTVVTPVVGQTASSSTFNVRGKDRVFDNHRLRIQNSVDDEIFEIDSSNNGVSQAGANAILTGSSDTDFYNNLKTSILGNLNGSFNVSYSAFAGSFSKGIQWGNNGAVGLSITSSLGTELDGLPFTFSGWVDVTSNGGSVNAIYAEETSIGAGRGRVLQIVGSGALQFIIHYVDGVGNKTDTYQLNGFRASYTGTLTHVAVVKGPQSPGNADSSLYINGSYVSWSSTSLGTPSGTATINSPDLYHIGWPGASPGFGHTSDPGIIDDVTLLNISCSQAQIDELYHGGKAIVDIQNDLTAIDFSTHVVAHYNFEESLGDVLNNSIIRDEKRFRNLVVTDSDAFNRITQVTTTLPLLHPSASFTITPTSTGVYGNLTLTEVGVVFSSLSNGSGGVDAVTGDVRFANDNVITIPRTDLTGSERNILTRFSAPGGPEVQSIGYLDAYTTTYSVHNALPFRNSSVLGSGSGEQGTIRVEDHLGLRRGLRTLRGLHMGQFGIDSQYGSVTALNYPSSGSFNKQHRNRSRAYQYSSGELIITGSNYDNMHINTPIPRSEFQYSWIRSAISGSNWENTQTRILGYAPRDGIVSSSAGYVEAIIFPTASSIIGS